MWKDFRRQIQPWLKNPVFPWAVVFILGCFIVPQNGGQLELPRMITLRAMADDHSFQIGRYIDWTDEWSRTPDGRYYNNRAPGPVLLPFPVFWVVDRIVELGEHGKVDDRGRRPWPATPQRTTLSFLFQEIPFSLLVMLGASWLLAQGASLLAIHFFALAAFFGNTAAIFMNNWSGHGITAVFILGAILALFYRRYFWVGFCYGNALLCDYGIAVLLVPLLLMLCLEDKRVRIWGSRLILGGIFPGLLWIWYHTVAFGGPLIVANAYQNPMYQDMRMQGNFLQIFRPFPDLDILMRLLLGAERGILPTQPWILAFAIIFPLCLTKKIFSQERRSLAIFSFTGLGLLLWMNSMYGGWHAGDTAGPRYLCAIFPVWALLVALFYDRVPRIGKYFLWASLAMALVFRGLVFANNPMAPVTPLWSYLWTKIVEKETLTNWLRLGIYFALLALAAYQSKKKAASPKRGSFL